MKLTQLGLFDPPLDCCQRCGGTWTHWLDGRRLCDDCAAREREAHG